jgi:hypothetical protein
MMYPFVNKIYTELTKLINDKINSHLYSIIFLKIISFIYNYDTWKQTTKSILVKLTGIHIYKFEFNDNSLKFLMIFMRLYMLMMFLSLRSCWIDDYADVLQISEEELYFLSCKSTFFLNNMLLLIHGYLLAIRKAS